MNCENLLVREIDLQLSEYQENMRALFSKLSAAEVKICAEPLLQTLDKYQYQISIGSSFDEPLEIKRMRMGYMKKADIIDFLLLFFTPANIHYFLEALPAHMSQLFYALADNHYLSGDAANSIYGKRVFEGAKYWSLGVIEELSPYIDFRREYGFGHGEYCIIAFKDNALCTLINASQMLMMRKATPSVKGLNTYNGEMSIFQELPFVTSLYESGQLKVGSSKLYTKSFEKAVAKLEMDDFHIQSSNQLVSYCSPRYYVPLQYAVYADEFGISSDLNPEDLIASVVKSYDGIESSFFKTFLPYIKGFNASYFNWFDIVSFYEKVKKIFSSCDFKDWKSVEYVCKLMRTTINILLNVENEYLFLNYGNMERSRLNNAYTEKPISFDNQVHQISDAAVKSILFALASWGVLEIAYEPTMPTDATSPFDALRYVRLTALGRYVYGLDKEYTPPVAVNQDNPFELADDRLLIKVLNPASPRLFLIEQFAQPVAPTLYKVDEKQFLREVNTKTELEIKIKLFKRTFGKSLPQVWTNFFDDLLMRCEAFTTPGKAYVIRRVNKADRRLQEIILSDTRLKSFVVRAEGYLILIERSHVPEFDKIMREYGYLL